MKKGKVNYKGRIRNCAISGLRFNESEMIHKDGKWINPKYDDIPQKQGAKQKVFGPNT